MSPIPGTVAADGSSGILFAITIGGTTYQLSIDLNTRVLLVEADSERRGSTDVWEGAAAVRRLSRAIAAGDDSATPLEKNA